MSGVGYVSENAEYPDPYAVVSHHLFRWRADRRVELMNLGLSHFACLAKVRRARRPLRRWHRYEAVRPYRGV